MADFDMVALIKKIDREFEEYWVTSGAKVRMPDGSTYIVTNIIFSDEMRKQSPEGKVWGLFCMVDIHSGSNWETPIPRMSEGSADIRLLMGGPEKRITDVIFKSMRKTAQGKTIRTYQVMDDREEITRITVTSR
jgi:hypothetical protein